MKKSCVAGPIETLAVKNTVTDFLSSGQHSSNQQGIYILLLAAMTSYSYVKHSMFYKKTAYLLL